MYLSFKSQLTSSRMVIGGASAKAGRDWRSKEIYVQTKTGAVSISFSKGGRALAKAAEQTGAPEGAPRAASPSLLKQMLGSIASISEQMRGVQEKLASGTLDAAAQTAHTEELAKLGAEYSRITGSDTYKRLQEITRQIQQSIQQGASASSLSNALMTERGMLGEEFLASVQSGDLFKIGTVGQSLSTIAAADSALLASDASLLDDISNAVRTATDALTGALIGETGEQAAPVPVIETGDDPVEVMHMTFAAAEETALTLRTFSARDMFKLAAAHVKLEPESALMLVHNPLKDGAPESDLGLPPPEPLLSQRTGGL